MSVPLIQFNNVVKGFGDVVVLNGISFSISSGQVTTIIGKSGAGKSVILKLMIGLMKPDSGEIIFDGSVLTGRKRSELHAIKKRMGYMFQNVALFDSMTIFDNVALPLEEKTKLTPQKIKEKVYDKLEKLEILHAENKFPAEISGGMKKRVGLARALIMDPEIILFDEPTTGLDPIRKNAVHSMISHMQRKLKFTAVIVSHEIPDVLHISQKVIMLDGGKILADCPPDEFEKIENPVLQAFLKGSEFLKDDPGGNYSKPSISHKFEETFGKFTGSGKNCIIIVFKINEMELINEDIGFVIGQKVIQHLVAFIEQGLNLSKEDFRYCDDLIITILQDSTLETAGNLLKKLKNKITVYPPLPRQHVNFMTYTISAGFTDVKNCESAEEIIKPAVHEMESIGQFDLS